jgi:hypothetical protein
MIDEDKMLHLQVKTGLLYEWLRQNNADGGLNGQFTTIYTARNGSNVPVYVNVEGTTFEFYEGEAEAGLRGNLRMGKK